jgi:predicted MPP superfamily phosphohydrolase
MEKINCLSCGDIHGRTDWKKIDVNLYDLIVFVGDYVDSFYVSDVEMLSNLKDIIQLKLDYPDKVVLLLGNHDIQYFFLNEGYGCSGYRPTMASVLSYLFKENKGLFKAAHQVGNTIWSHAGISKGWYDWNKDKIDEVAAKFETKDLAETLNNMLKMNRNYNGVLHQVGRKRGGRYQFGGITWADRDETKNDYLEGYHQIVGHTPIERITLFGDEKGSIRYIDVMDERNKERNFYEHEILVDQAQ